MKIASTQISIPNKAFEIYLSGCNANPKCAGCHNSELWDYGIGTEVTKDIIIALQKKIANAKLLIENIWILGGEPLDQDCNELLYLLRELKSSNLPIWLFTRYEIDEINIDIRNSVNYIKTGKYEKDLLTDNNIYFGIKLASTNQKIFKVG